MVIKRILKAALALVQPRHDAAMIARRAQRMSNRDRVRAAKYERIHAVLAKGKQNG